MNGVGRITENKWMRRLRSDLRIVLDLILRSDLRFGPAQNEHLVVRTDGHWPFRASGLLEPLARLAKEGEKICWASGQCRGLPIIHNPVFVTVPVSDTDTDPPKLRIPTKISINSVTNYVLRKKIYFEQS